MPTPQRVIDEARAAEQQMAELNGAQPPAEPNSGEGGDEGGAPPAAREADTQFGVGQEARELPQTPAPNAPQSGPIDAEAFAQLQQRLHTLEGNFNRANAQLAEERGRNQTLERMIAERINERSAAPAAPAPAPASLVSDAEIEELGPDLVDVMRRLVREGLQGAVNPLLDRLQQLEATLTQTAGVAQHSAESAARIADERFVTRMNELVKDGKGNPDWSHINTMHESGDNRFVDWLNKNGEDSDEPRLNIIRRAFQARDADRCAGMINRFKQSAGMPDGTAATPAEIPPTAAAAALVSPSTTGNGQPTAGRGTQARTYTKDDVDRHYDEKVKGKWKGKEAKWQQIANDMDKAVVEGRFVATPPRR